MSDPIEDAYEKYLAPSPPEPDAESEIFARESEAPCPMCGSKNIDRSSGYRGEYKCLDCGHRWQVGGRDAKY